MAMSFIETLSTGITLLNFGKELYDLVTGHTVSRKLDKIYSKIERVDNHVYFLDAQEVWDTIQDKQQVFEDLKQIKEARLPLQRAIGADIVISKPIISPDRMKSFFLSNPEEILFGIRPLRGLDVPQQFHNDPTMVPVTFSKWGQEFLGYVKIGYLRDYLDCDYRPQTGLILPSIEKNTVKQLPGIDVTLTQRSDVLIIKRTDLNLIIAQAKQDSPIMTCGILSGRGNVVTTLFPVSNIQESRVHFQMDPREQLEVFRKIEKRDLDFVAIYYSQADGNAYPSRTTVYEWPYPEVACLIISLATLMTPEIGVFNIKDEEITKRNLYTYE
jgi:proteasome lid subunit RPN8/RPN11